MLIRLTGVPHPELNEGKPQPVYIDCRKVLTIEPGMHSPAKLETAEAQRQAIWELHDEVERAARELQKPPATIHAETEEHARAVDLYVKSRDVAAEMLAAYKLVAHWHRQPLNHKPVECTIVGLSCGTALEQGVMLTRVAVMEAAEEVARLVREERQKWWWLPAPRA